MTPKLWSFCGHWRADRVHGLLFRVGEPARAGVLHGHHRVLAVVLVVLPLQIPGVRAPVRHGAVLHGLFSTI